ncbi:hypothetical protein [Rhizobium sp. Root1220]|uniref:hypothetical protein n=1 Tax=Rhizobium sp. Root1220 TaxID=1736432 RepID=UPI0006FD2639|nr:hypothetical protein [Rhizobium sp. Root1220]KQV83249.1 hypothetical protein ASC90_21900 [Rhizobium sp. Root1220]
MQAMFKVCERGKTGHVLGRVTIMSGGHTLDEQVSEARRVAIEQGIVKKDDLDKVVFVYVD